MSFEKSENNGLKQIKKNSLKILSIGISTNGNSEIEMAKLAPNAHIIATTIDKKGIEKTKQIVSDNKLSDQIELKLENVKDKTNYLEEEFDFIYARLVLHYLNDIEFYNAIRELNRILKKDGLLYIVVRSDKCTEAKRNIIEYNKNNGMTKYIAYSKDVIERRFYNKQNISKILKKHFKIKNIKEYEEKLYVDYERKKEVKAKNYLIEISCKKSR